MFDVYRMDKVQNERGREKTSGLCEHHIVPRRISQCMLMMVCLLDECEAHPAQPSPAHLDMAASLRPHLRAEDLGGDSHGHSAPLSESIRGPAESMTGATTDSTALTGNDIAAPRSAAASPSAGSESSAASDGAALRCSSSARRICS